MRKPLTRPELRTIQERNRNNPDVMALLRELRRLHGVLNNCWQVFDGFPPERTNSPLDLLVHLINNEPCVQEQREQYERVGKQELPRR